jgi:hypothetical protein
MLWAFCSWCRTRRIEAWLSALLLPLTAAAEPPPPIRWLPLAVHVVEMDGQPVAPDGFIEARVARANQIFAPYRVGFVIVKRLPLTAAHAKLETRADRDALGKEVQKRVIDVFVVESLRDVDEPERMRRGVHWHSSTFPGAHFVIVSLLGGPDVMAHELGHYLGNPEHSQTPGNLMSYERGQGEPFLDAAQLTRIERTLRGYFARKDLVAAPAPAL